MKLEIEGSCAVDRRRIASSNGVILIISFSCIFAWHAIYGTNARVKAEEVRQTAIAGAFGKAGTAIIVLGQGANILYWDDNAVKLFGFTNEEVINRNIDMIVPSDEDHEEHIRKSVESNDPRIKIITCKGKNKDGSSFPIAIRVYSPFQKDKVLVLADELKSDTLTNR